MRKRVSAGLFLYLLLQSLSSCTILRSAGLLKHPDIKGQVLDASGFESVKDIIIVSGATRYTQSQEFLLSSMENAWKNDSQLRFTTHAIAKTEYQYGLVPPPSLEQWGTGRALEKMVFQRMPERDSTIGILVLWLIDWRGEKCLPMQSFKDIFTESLVKELYPDGIDEPARIIYRREAVAQLFDSKTGKELWRAHKSYLGVDAPLAEGQSVPRCIDKIRKKNVENEFNDFSGFFAEALINPEK